MLVALPILFLAWVGLQAPAHPLAKKGSSLASHAARRHPASGSARARATSAPDTPSLTTFAGMTEVTQTVTVGLLHRSYVVFSPSVAPAGKLPAIVVLEGRGEPLGKEEIRDGLLPLVAKGQAYVIYPIGIGRSWNAGACCGVAHLTGVDDLSFLRDVLSIVGAGKSVSTVLLAGFSNGGRMAYRLMCASPGPVSALAVVDAVPVADCPPGPPVPLLQVAGTQDGFVSYDATVPPHVLGSFVEASATGQVAAWVARNGCTGPGVTQTVGTLRLQAWTRCAAGSAVQFATYVGEGHFWPQGGPGTPPASQVVWLFFTNPTHLALPAPTPMPVAKATGGGRPVPSPR